MSKCVLTHGYDGGCHPIHEVRNFFWVMVAGAVLMSVIKNNFALGCSGGGAMWHQNERDLFPDRILTKCHWINNNRGKSVENTISASCCLSFRETIKRLKKSFDITSFGKTKKLIRLFFLGYRNIIYIRLHDTGICGKITHSPGELFCHRKVFYCLGGLDGKQGNCNIEGMWRVPVDPVTVW